jgi:hypothetical protein
MMHLEILYWVSYTIVIVFLLIFGYSLIFSFFSRIPYISSKKNSISQMIKLANVKESDSITDLGCGDMKVLIQLEKEKNITGTGYEISPIPYLLAKIKLILNRSKNTIYFKNFLKVDLQDTNVIFVYLTPPILKKLEKKIVNECSKGTKIISNSFSFPNLKPKLISESVNHQKIFYYEI